MQLSPGQPVSAESDCVNVPNRFQLPTGSKPGKARAPISLPSRKEIGRLLSVKAGEREGLRSSSVILSLSATGGCAVLIIQSWPQSSF